MSLKVRIAICIVVCVIILTACKAQGGTRYDKAGDPCYVPGATSVDDQGRDLVCERDKQGNFSWLIP